MARHSADFRVAAEPIVVTDHRLVQRAGTLHYSLDGNSFQRHPVERRSNGNRDRCVARIVEEDGLSAKGIMPGDLWRAEA